MSKKLNTNTQPNDSIDRRKVVVGKKRCDWCERPAAVIWECACKTAEGTVLWYDLCDDCVGTKAPIADGGPKYREIEPEWTRSTNIYGPRPRGCGALCKDCVTAEYPLFGHTISGKPSDATRCVACLVRYFSNQRRQLKLTPEAAGYFANFIQPTAPQTRSRP